MTEYILSFSLLIASILLIRAIFRKKASARLIYALWLAVIIKLCIPFSFINVDLPDIQYAGTPSTEAIVPSTTEKEDAQAAPSPIDPSPSYDTNVEIPETAKPSSNIPNTSKKIEPAFDYRRIFTTVWVAGSSIVFLVIAVSVTVFNIKLLRSRTYYKSIGKTKIYVSDITASPCVAGIVPTIYITTLARTSDKLSLVVLHEKTHIKHGDHIWSVLRLLAICAYWWNPLIWAAALFSKRDSELACDEAVVSKMKDTDRLTYAAMIVDMIPKTGSIAVGFSNGPIKERIDRLMRNYSKKILAGVLAVMLALLSFGCANISDTPKSPAGNNGNNTGTAASDDTSENMQKTDFTYYSIEDLANSEYVKSVNQYKKLKVEDTVSYEVTMNVQENEILVYISAPINYKSVSYPTTIHFPEITPFHENYASLFASNGCISVTFINYNSLALSVEEAMYPIDILMEIFNECSFIDTDYMLTTASGINTYLSFLIAQKYAENICGVSVIDAVCDMTAQYDLNNKSASLLKLTLGGTPDEASSEYSSRSVINFAGQIKCPVLIMNYLQNTDFSIEQAYSLKSAMESFGGACEVVGFDMLSSDFHTDLAAGELISFIKTVTKGESYVESSKVNIEITTQSSLYEYIGKLVNNGTTEQLGDYTIEASGLSSTVILEMEHDSLLKSISVFGHTITTNNLSYAGRNLYGNIDVRLYEFENAIIFSRYYYDVGDTWIFTSNGYEHIKVDNDTCITIIADENENLRFKRSAVKFNAAVDQDYSAPLTLATSRDDFFYEEGTAAIENGRLVTTIEYSYTISDKFDLDEIFEYCRSNGYNEVEGFTTVDEMLNANKNK